MSDSKAARSPDVPNVRGPRLCCGFSYSIHLRPLSFGIYGGLSSSLCLYLVRPCKPDNSMRRPRTVPMSADPEVRSCPNNCSFSADDSPNPRRIFRPSPGVVNAGTPDKPRRPRTFGSAATESLGALRPADSTCPRRLYGFLRTLSRRPQAIANCADRRWSHPRRCDREHSRSHSAPLGCRFQSIQDNLAEHIQFRGFGDNSWCRGDHTWLTER